MESGAWAFQRAAPRAISRDTPRECAHFSAIQKHPRSAHIRINSDSTPISPACRTTGIDLAHTYRRNNKMTFAKRRI